MTVTLERNREKVLRATGEISVLGYPVDMVPIETCLDDCFSALKRGESRHIVTLNPEMMIYAKQDERYKRLLLSADWRLPDGVGLVWALKRQGHANAFRVPGIEFSEALISRAAEEGVSIALIGADLETNTAAVSALQAKYPRLVISYAHDGYYLENEESSIVAACKESGAQIILLALGFPRQEFWIENYQSTFTQPTVMVGVGGSFDVWSGKKQRAPKLFRQLQLEWLYRITSEPWRIQRVSKTLPEYLVKAVLLNHNEL